MADAEVTIAVSTGTGWFLTANDDDGKFTRLPYWLLDEDKAHRLCARELLRRCTGLEDGEWVILRFVHTIPSDVDDVDIILYAVELIDKVPISQGLNWSSLEDVLAVPNLARLFMMAWHIPGKPA